MKVNLLISFLPLVLFVSPVMAESIAVPSSTSINVSNKSKVRTIKIAKGFSFVNLYATHNTKSTVLMRFNGGERVMEIEQRGSMMKVKFGNKTGWIVTR